MTIIQTLSTFSALLPIIIGSFVIRRSRVYLFFWFFLLYGLMTDNMSMFYFLSGKSEWVYRVAVVNQNFYSLVDAVFLVLFLHNVYPDKNKIHWVSIPILLGWTYFYLLNIRAWFEIRTMSSYFDTIYHMLLSIIAAVALIRMTRVESNTSHAVLWLTIGVFFYNFCVFFVTIFLELKIIFEIWYLNSLFNVITMFMYATGYFFALQRRNQSSH